jgi:sugar phosphate permease
MDNPETPATLGTHDIGRRKTKQKQDTQNYKDEQHETHKKRGLVQVIVKGKHLLLLVRDDMVYHHYIIDV